MYIEFIFVFIDYFSTLEKKSFMHDWGIAILISSISIFINSHKDINTYSFINEANSFITTLLGFTLASLSLFLASNIHIDKLKHIKTNKTIRGKKISLYKLLLINFSYSIVIESILCVSFYIGKLLPNIFSEYVSIIINLIYIILFFNILLLTIRSITDLYFIISKE